MSFLVFTKFWLFEGSISVASWRHLCNAYLLAFPQKFKNLNGLQVESFPREYYWHQLLLSAITESTRRAPISGTALRILFQLGINRISMGLLKNESPAVMMLCENTSTMKKMFEGRRFSNGRQDQISKVQFVEICIQ